MSRRNSPCTGACCSVFVLHYNPQEIRSQASHIHEGQYIAAMVEPLTLDAAAQRCADYGLEWPASIHSAGPIEEIADRLYTCRFWDERTRGCVQYANRPEMCSSYPYRRKCLHCGWHGGKSSKTRNR